MASTATVTTNDSRGLGYQQGQFSGPTDRPLDQQFFDQAFAGYINENKIYRAAYACDVIGECNSSMLLEEIMDVQSDCYPDITVLEYAGKKNQITVKTDTTIPAYPGTGTIALSTSDFYVDGTFFLPVVGNLLVLPPSGELAVVVAITSTTNNATLIVQLKSKTAAQQALLANYKVIVVPGAEIQDCEAPTGSAQFDDVPWEQDYSMVTWGNREELCGDVINKCQWLKIPLLDANDNLINNVVYSDIQQKLFRSLEDYKHRQTWLNSDWGIIPTVRARGIHLTPSTNDAVTVDDIRYYKSQFDLMGLKNREFLIIAGGAKYSQYQQMLLAAGVVQLDHSEQPLDSCKYLNLEWCGLRVEGLTLHIVEECTFSNGKDLGSTGMVFPNSAIWIPMGAINSSKVVKNINSPYLVGTNKNTAIERIYFKDISKGRVWDTLPDSNGILGPRNTYGAGVEKQEWTVKTRFYNRMNCANGWAFEGL